MKDLIENFPQQLQESLAITQEYTINSDRTLTNVVICGLGGSGIGGELIKEWIRPHVKVPVEVCHSYTLPGYVSHSTLIIACSYSGNTEETLSALEEGFQKDAFIIGVSSGGKLTQRLSDNGFTTIKVPGGLPPRSALAYPLVQVLEIFEQLGLLRKSLKEEISKSVKLLKDSQEDIIEEAKAVLHDLGDKRLLLYAEDTFRPVLLRTCQQLNENSKELAFFNVIPEMNHNEIVGWAQATDQLLTVFLRSDVELERNQKRLDLTYGVIQEKSATRKVFAFGEGLIQQSLYAIHLFDWLSFFRSEENGVDVVEVNVIDYLKGELAK
ncbi:MAG: bifunctional phosphoglucose/phosphomannose isomerase [bacterium]|nr:bifunctional phosphoglucose/phosphomannose isomerase [bacterium]